MHDLTGKKILILATNGFEQSELEVPRDRLQQAGAEVHIVAPEPGEIRGWEKKDWGRPVKVDKTLDQASAEGYDAIVLPGGQINPDLLRVNEKALKLIKAFYDQNKVVAAVCHGPAGLVNVTLSDGTHLVEGRRVSAFTNEEEAAVGLTDVVPFLLQTRLEERGAKHSGAPNFAAHVVRDGRLVTGQNPASAAGVAEAALEALRA